MATRGLLGRPRTMADSQEGAEGVIFGTRASADLRATVVQLIAAHKPWVELREVVEVPFSYDLQVRPLPGAAAAGEHATSL